MVVARSPHQLCSDKPGPPYPASLTVHRVLDPGLLAFFPPCLVGSQPPLSLPSPDSVISRQDSTSTTHAHARTGTQRTRRQRETLDRSSARKGGGRKELTNTALKAGGGRGEGSRANRARVYFDPAPAMDAADPWGRTSSSSAAAARRLQSRYGTRIVIRSIFGWFLIFL
jgi:hypothetical protein